MAKSNLQSPTHAQAWRKKPRKWAPKSRLGCKTCKIRRVKCDLSTPSCLKCTSTGRTCDASLPSAHSATPLPCSPSPPRSQVSRSDTTPTTTATTTHHYHHHPLPNPHHAAPLPTTLPPLLLLPPTPSHHLTFFTLISLPSLTPHFPSPTWTRTLSYFAHTSPPVHAAALALASLHRVYADRSTAPKPQYLKDWSRAATPLRYYNRAIGLLTRARDAGDGDVGGGDRDATTALTTLLVCYLFICFEHLAGEDARAVAHLAAGVRVLRGLERSAGGRVGGEVGEVVALVGRQMRRLDRQVTQFLRDWEPGEEEGGGGGEGGCGNSDSDTHVEPFASLEDAADTLQIHVARVMRLRWIAASHADNSSEIPPPPPSHVSSLATALSTWSTRFHLSPSLFPPYPAPLSPSLSLLHLQHTLATLLLHTSTAPESTYDAHLPTFRLALSHARTVLAPQRTLKRPRNSPPVSPDESPMAPPSFTPELGILPALFIIASKCRDPRVRREALGLLRARPMREASWESGGTARVLEFLIKVEEGGKEVRAQEDVPAWRRVADVSYVYCGKERGGVEIEMSWRLDGVREWCVEVIEL